MTLALADDAPAPSPIPATVDDLHRLADLAFASNWLLAATVWAWTTKGRPGPRSVDFSTDLYSITGFAKLGLRGLSTKDSVIKYRNAWQHALDRGLVCSVQAGETPELPETPFGEFAKRIKATAEKTEPASTETAAEEPPKASDPEPPEAPSEEPSEPENEPIGSVVHPEPTSRIERCLKRAEDATASLRNRHPGPIGDAAYTLQDALAEMVFSEKPEFAFLRALNAVTELAAALEGSNR